MASIKVRALKMVWYKLQRRRIGEVFEIDSEKHFSKLAMERMDGTEAKAPAKARGPVEEPLSKASKESAASVI